MLQAARVEWVSSQLRANPIHSDPRREEVLAAAEKEAKLQVPTLLLYIYLPR